MFSDAEQNIPIFSIHVVTVIVYKYLQFSINDNKFYCIFVASIKLSTDNEEFTNGAGRAYSVKWLEDYL
ncbi:hypothetical protein BANORC5_31950 [Bacteroides nordii]|nr:hypothetical protein BANORC5_31950 [Bacteroides nordii]